MKKQLQVSAIKDGTVIDHIPAQDLFNVINILQLADFTNPMTIGSNLESKKLGRKAILKISNYFFKDEEINRIALLAPHAKLNIIREYKVVEKRVVEVPDAIEGIAKCMNPKCITNHENVMTRFRVLKDKEEVALKCDYCEKITDKEHIELR
mgnify:CR=1 FL=1